MKMNVIQNNFNMNNEEEPYVETTIYSIDFFACSGSICPFFRVTEIG